MYGTPQSECMDKQKEFRVPDESSVDKTKGADCSVLVEDIIYNIRLAIF